MERSEEYATNRFLSQTFGDIQRSEAMLEMLSERDPECNKIQTAYIMSRMCYHALKAILKVLISIESKL